MKGKDAFDFEHFGLEALLGLYEGINVAPLMMHSLESMIDRDLVQFYQNRFQILLWDIWRPDSLILK
ncbi:hypothetical protein [Sphingobacterium sp. UBA5996]|uniref:hypothetical protein n=1 Tax=Sphingobacterium sp. UBA5996 TaxID=1947505 RepID=UPI0025EF4C25|nr:hypothetical protein [Sphingobacterium sp. UBA5996]